jgi:DNA replication ATP-dependent helicase Dna2
LLTVSAIFAHHNFDYCIVDEASQLTLPVCIGPLRFADKFILVGDHFQLPPLVRDSRARDGGYDVSLFKRLSEAHPESLIHLAHQYRMNSDIMLISNELIYSHRLRCGNIQVAQARLVLDRLVPGLQLIHSDYPRCKSNCWIEHVMNPRFDFIV